MAPRPRKRGGPAGRARLRQAGARRSRRRGDEGRSLALQWRARGHQAVARQWADRARGLLAGVSASGTHGYLAYFDAATALDEDDAAALTRAAATLRETVANTVDASSPCSAAWSTGSQHYVKRVSMTVTGSSTTRCCRCSMTRCGWNGPVTSIGWCCARVVSGRSTSAGLDGVDAPLGRHHRGCDRP